MRSNFPPSKPAQPSAFSLVEVVLALGIVCFAMLTLLALLPLGLKSEQSSFNETSAVNLMRSLTTDLSNTPARNTVASTPTNNTASYRFGLPLPSYYATNATTAQTNIIYVNDSQQPVASKASGTFRVVCTYNPAVTSGITAPVGMLMQIYWPASATTTNYQGSVESYVTFPQNLP